MSTTLSCPSNYVLPVQCPSSGQGYNPCASFGTGNTGMLIQNGTQNTLIAYSYNLTPQVCFTIPFLPSPTQPVYMVTNKGTSPVTFAFFGGTDPDNLTPYGTVTTQTTVPTTPVVVSTALQPVVQPSQLPADWVFPDIRKEKPVWVLIVAGALFFATGILLIVAGVMRNKQVLRVYSDLKGAKDEEAQDLIANDEGLTEEYSKFRSTGLIVAGVFLILIVIGLAVGIMFLPGYPLGKYISYSYCSARAAGDPVNEWSWSLPPESGFWSFVCKALGACICRSAKLETDCLLYRITNTTYMPNPWQSSLKKSSVPVNCLCCDGQQCGTVEYGRLTACQ